ncbi:UDP-N-acetylmuramate:L-alanyl-gamma-D-glutamyl-meso-diaminopimelate ligase [Amphritea balenae]|uniref:UDP-N-acetylmuramate--L-alanyl-gamma-D-glutamyl-meso-2,6-diaminoheptandioate ligase n=1 Tax=Amphritea balenae TaxID=452629 RepID=A0A3P1SMY6_9GAMM|nr:UDP-N-acetylmuramate:L-alanyl-gamma-D-glutamyl-meso-diaminopimelate ligase [Amphritea balenae]RRC98339.1 UDP-N-acetylmuramate:L-alanyl-gamma-D-glutamyl-meso-diaminopimelate ligase [Amphritea balenae]GGK81082.1 UDP-N-acetylmuramate--L-alanyl-gamma-D-glutamyl-meso-2,6-diaminoheptandioate ligase [Amphritea balenae]
MHVHILGICGTFMGSLAVLAKELGHQVTGSDANVYPPMSTQLEAQGIELIEGFDPSQLKPAPDIIIVGNAMTRGNPCVEYMLEQGLRYTSGPQWLSEHLLQDKWVLAVAGTHGKTTTATMLAWLLEYAKMEPGFLIGGVPKNFDRSARVGGSPFFVIEADEYDTAFFDKRSKFVHYRPRTVILNNLEFDHADIFDDLAAIQRQFHHLVRIVPANGQVILPAEEPSLEQVLEQGCWTPVVRASISEKDINVIVDGVQWQARLLNADGSRFEVLHEGEAAGVVSWGMTGRHSVNNGLMALIAARHVGVQIEHGIEALSNFGGVKRRMELIGEIESIKVYDDFAHHPTAIETTLQGVRAQVGDAPVIAIIEPRSNTMRMGMHRQQLAASATQADKVYWYQPEGLDWSLDDVISASNVPAVLATDTEQIISEVCSEAEPGSHIVIMSNGGFGGIHTRMVQALQSKYANGG